MCGRGGRVRGDIIKSESDQRGRYIPVLIVRREGWSVNIVIPG